MKGSFLTFCLVSLFIVGLCSRVDAQVTESFDTSGNNWSNTTFPDAYFGTFFREALGSGIGAPNASPPLPINQGGDKEGRQTSLGGYRLTANVPANDVADVVIDGYVAIGSVSQKGTRSASFVARANVQTGKMNAYMADITQLTDSPNVQLKLVRVRESIIGGPGSFRVTSRAFPVNSSSENFRLRFTVQGTQLSASVWRVSSTGETPVDLSSNPGVQATLTTSDAELTSGRTGVHAFSLGGHSIFFDDVTVTDLLPPDFIRGDANNDGFVDLSDTIAIFDHVHNGTPIPAPRDRADANDNEFITIADAFHCQANFSCGGVPAIVSPFPNPGQDPTNTTGDFGSEQPGYAVHFSMGTVTPTEVEIVVTVDTPEPLSAVQLVVSFDSALTPKNPAFVLAPGLHPQAFDPSCEFVDGNLYSVSLQLAGCNPQLLPAGNGQTLGSIWFDGSACALQSPLEFVADASVGGVQRYSTLITSTFVDKRPSGDFQQQSSTNFIRGDMNSDGFVDFLPDASRLILYFFDDGPAPQNCSGQPNLDAGDINDNEYITFADWLLFRASTFCGGPPVPGPSTCALDPTSTKRGFDSVNPAYTALATAEVTTGKVEVQLQISAPGDVAGATLVLDFDPNVLTPEPPVGQEDGIRFCTNNGVTLHIAQVDENRVIVSVQTSCGSVFPVNPVTNLIDLGTVHFTHAGGVSCGQPGVSLVPEHTRVNANGCIVYRATIVDAAYADNHPALLTDCREETKDFVRGDANGDGDVDLSDAVYNLAYQFSGGPSMCLDAHDANDDGAIDISDPVYLLAWKFRGGPDIPPPFFPNPGSDPTPDDPCNELGCAVYPRT